MTETATDLGTMTETAETVIETMDVVSPRDGGAGVMMRGALIIEGMMIGPEEGITGIVIEIDFEAVETETTAEEVLEITDLKLTTETTLGCLLEVFTSTYHSFLYFLLNLL